MAKKKIGVFGSSFVVLGALLMAVLFFGIPEFRSTSETIADEADGAENEAMGNAEEPEATQSAPAGSDSSATTETAKLLPGKETTLRQPIKRKTASGEFVVLFEAGETLEVVALQGSRIYLRTPEGETIGIPVGATDWEDQKD